MKCFYHSADLDGHCSAAIVKAVCPECELIGINYGDAFPWDLFVEAEERKSGSIILPAKEPETVYMVDFCLQPFTDMVKLKGMCNLTWIDHHKSAIESYEAYIEEQQRALMTPASVSIAGFRDSRFAACELTWEYFNPAFRNQRWRPTDDHTKLMESIPLVVRLLGRYDVWDHSDPDTLSFQYGIRLMSTDPGRYPLCMENLWDRLFLETQASPGRTLSSLLIQDGCIVMRYVDQENRKYCAAAAFETELDGFKCIAVNKLLTSSQLFDSVWDPAKHDAMLTFGWRNSSWTVSLFSTRPDIDVSAVCKARGGGGHKGAAGFQCVELPFALARGIYG